MRKILFRGFIAIALTAPLTAGFLTRVAAQPGGRVDPSLYSGLRWRMIGPFRGGRVNGVTGVPGQPNVFYMNNILDHFATAYFGLYLKGEQDKQAYFEPGWKGFKRGTTVGLTLEHATPVK